MLASRLSGPVGLADFPCAVAQLAKPTDPVGLADSLVVEPANLPEKLSNRPSGISSDVGADLCDWRAPMLAYLRDSSAKVDKSVRRSAFKYVLHNDELYRRTIEDLLLKCLGSDLTRVAMREIHEGICGTHQSAPKMKWLSRRAGFYWSTMMADCFRYYKGCEECQRFGNVQLVPTIMLHPIIKQWPFRGWGLDFIGQIHPPSSKGHRFYVGCYRLFH
jgi:hypothetical protein